MQAYEVIKVKGGQDNEGIGIGFMNAPTDQTSYAFAVAFAAWMIKNVKIDSGCDYRAVPVPDPVYTISDDDLALLQKAATNLADATERLNWLSPGAEAKISSRGIDHISARLEAFQDVIFEIVQEAREERRQTCSP